MGENRFLFLAQEPWVYKNKIRGIPSSWKMYQDSECNNPRACIFTSASVPGILLTQFSHRDMTAILIRDETGGLPLVVVSAYLPYDGTLPPPRLARS